MGGIFVDATIEKQATGIADLWSWCDRLDNEIKAINTRTNQGNNSPNEGWSADVQSLSKKVDVTAESGHLLENIAALSAKIDQNTAEISHWKAEVEALPTKFQDVLGPDNNTMNAKYQALSTKIDNGLNDSPPAVNRGLAIGLSLGLGIPLTIAIIFLCVMWIRRRYDFHGVSSERDS
ncbi:hypothetical protein N7455_008981 [Penicillium solitum]|uniref:uncharacterized protein n=1 Tax=Penicillium solitum TaxID=60172 RepID=UPI00180E9F34|nr:hypothetical protein HAV15_004889 [Penicillium sp. str. \